MKLMSILALMALMTLTVVEPAFAQGSGATSGLYNAIVNFLAGPGGKLLALALGVAGLFLWLVKQETAAGISMILAGILIIFAPRIVGGAADILQAPLESIQGIGSKQLNPDN